jgi:glycosyltransferase involved in cell wall biosynthesis
MKIVLVGPAYPLRGGNALFVAHLYEALASSNDVTVISFSRLYPRFLFPGVRQNDVSGTAIKKHPAEQIIDCLNPFTWVRAARRAASLQPDMLVFTWWNPFFGPIVRTIATLFKWMTGKPVVIIAENVISHEGRYVDVVLTKLALSTADRFLVLSGVVEQAIGKMFPAIKVFKSSLPVYDCYQATGEALTKEQALQSLKIAGRSIILFFGYIRTYKGLMNLLEALPAIRKEVTDVHLLIVGEFYDDPAPYREAITRLGIQDCVTIVAEYVPNEQVHLYFTASDVVVLPYNEATQSGILSIAYGFTKPVIVTNVGGLAELVDENSTGFIVPPHDIPALSNAVIRFFAEGNRRRFADDIIAKRETNNFSSIRSIFDDILTDIQQS